MLDLVSKLQLSLTESGNSLLLAFLVISATWSFYVRSLAIVRPSSFVLVTNSTSFPSMMTGSNTLCSLAKEILSSLHFSAFSWTLFSRDHSITLLARIKILRFLKLPQADPGPNPNPSPRVRVRVSS